MVMLTQQCECTQCHWIGHLKMVKMVHVMVCKFYHNLKSNGTSLADSRLY